MGTLLGRQEFLRSDKASILREELKAMVESPAYNTVVRFTLVSTDGSQFVEKHMNYMANHLQMDHSQYVLNIKLMTKIRR